MTPLAKLLRVQSSVPRFMADDAAINTVGHRHWARLQIAGEIAMAYLTDAGCKVAAKKSALSSTDKGVRAAIKPQVEGHARRDSCVE